ncbi:MAG: histidine kinase [Chitinophagales bacterium]
MKKILLILFTLTNFYVQAQKFADKEFYLIDSLVLENVDEFNKNLIDSFLAIYHKDEIDTAKLNTLSILVDECWDPNIWPRYNELLLQNSLDLLASSTDKTLRKSYQNYLGHSYKNKAYFFITGGSSLKAKEFYYLALEQFKETGNKQNIGELYSILALTHSDEGDYVTAISYAEKSIALVKDNLEEENTLACYHNMAVIQMDIENYEEAKYYTNFSYEMAKKQGNLILKGQSLFMLGDLLRIEEKYALAKDTFLLGLSTFQELEEDYFLLKAYDKMAEIEPYLSQYNEALLWNIKLDSLNKKFKSIEYDIKVRQNYLSIWYYKEEFEKAKKVALETLNLLKSEKKIAEKAFVLQYLAKIAEKEKQFEKATNYLNQYIEAKDKKELDKSAKLGIKQVLQYKFEQQKEIDDLKYEKEIAIAKAQKQRNRIGFIAAAIIAGLIALFSILIFNRLKLIRKQKTKLDNAYEQLEESKKNELAVSNLKALQSQMNPHFIFNALNSVQDLVLLQDIRNSNKYLGKFSDLIRKILLSSKEQFITLEEEVEILSLYLDLEKLRFGEDFIIDLQCNVSEKQQDEIMLPAMFIQPYIENAIKHGLFHKEGKKELMVHFNIKNNALECIIKDNGIGQKKAAEFKQKRLHLHTGFSTEAINERIRLLNETSEKKIELEIEDLFEGDLAIGTKIILFFPI